MPASVDAVSCPGCIAAGRHPPPTPAATPASQQGMLHARNTLVGGVLPGGLCLRGLSGGERKRVSVAVGILAAPSIIFLDGEKA